MLDYHVHLIGHRDRQATKANICSFLATACHLHLNQIGFADHDLYWEDLNFKLIRETAGEYPQLQVRVGLEVDYIPGKEEEIAAEIASYPFDYVIGSIHQMNGWTFDYQGEELKHLRRDPDSLYQEYFALVEKAAASGLFDIIGHFDLIKLFKVRPRTDVRILASKALEAVKDNGLVLELNTNGRYKPVQEFYPEYKLLESIAKIEIPLTLGSDAHEPKNVGRDIPEACYLLKSLGVHHVTGFRQRSKTFIALP